MEDPNNKRFSVCLNEKTLERLESYCQKYGITKGEAVRRGVVLLLSQKKNP